MQNHRPAKQKHTAGKDTAKNAQPEQKISVSPRLLQFPLAEFISDKNAAAVCQTTAEADDQILYDVRNRIGRHRIISEVSHDD